MMATDVDSIQSDSKLLEDFPVFDTSLDDDPNFRRQLNKWSLKTEKLSSSLQGIVNHLQDFTKHGVAHYNSASRLVTNLMELAEVHEDTEIGKVALSEPVQKFAGILEKIEVYREMFMNQVSELTAAPLGDLAKKLSYITDMYKNVLQCREEYKKALGRFSACRHLSKMNEQQYSAWRLLAETVFDEKRKYQMALSKYLMDLREVHSCDMMSMLRRILEHMLTSFSFHNYAAQLLKEIEFYIDQKFTEAKILRDTFEDELKVYHQLRNYVNLKIQADYQDSMANFSEMASKAACVGTPGNKAARHFWRVLPGTSSAGKAAGELKRAASTDWLVIEEEGENNGDGSDSEVSVRKRSTTYSPLSPDPTGGDRMIRRRIGTIRRSSSNPNLLSSAMDLDSDVTTEPFPRVMSPDDVTRQRCSRPRSQSLVAYSLANNSTQVSNGHSTSPESDENSNLKSGSFMNVFSKKKGKDKKLSSAAKKNLARSNSDVGSPSGSGNGSKIKTSVSPIPEKTPSKGIWKKAKNYIGGLKDISSSKTDVHRNSLDSQQDSKPISDLEVPETPKAKQHLESSYTVEDLEWKSVERQIPVGWNQRGYLSMAEKPAGSSSKLQWNNVYCVVDSTNGHMLVQSEQDDQLVELANLQICTAKVCTPDLQDRNCCFRLITPMMEYVFQAVTNYESLAWVDSLNSATARALKKSDHDTNTLSSTEGSASCSTENIAIDARERILAVPGNQQCADCTSTNMTDLDWASINLGIVICIKCSGVHRSLGVHISKVRSLTLDWWDEDIVKFMESVGNKMSNSKYEGSLEDIKRPSADATKEERKCFIKQKYVDCKFVPPHYV